MSNQELVIKVHESRMLKDGLYDATGINFIYSKDAILDIWNSSYSKCNIKICGNNKEDYNKITEFITNNPDYCVGSAYETETVILFSSKPNKFKGKRLGSGFNYGSTNLICDCPKNLLILAEND